MDIAKETELRQAIATCDCGCSTIVLTKYNWYDETFDYGIALYKNEFYNEQQTVFRLICKRIKHAWYTLIGKEYLLLDVSLAKEQFELFKKNVNEI